MFEWATITIHLLANMIFAQYWLYGKWPNAFYLAGSIIIETTIYVILSLFYPQGMFLGALFSGLLVAVFMALLHDDFYAIPVKISIYGNVMTVFFPLCLSTDAIWEYAFYQAIFVLCMALSPMSIGTKENRHFHIQELYENNRNAYRFMVSLPYLTLLFLLLLMVCIRNYTIIATLSLTSVLLCFSVLLFILQKELVYRRYLEYMNEAMSRWQRESRDYMNTIRSQRHDFNLHLHAISGLVNQGDYDKCQQYVQNLVSQANDVNDIMPVCDPVVGSMLYTMRQEARRMGSDILYYITYDMQDISCNGFECNKIIGNLLQNAIDALQTPKDKEYGIRLSILKRRGNTVIICENRFHGDQNRIARVFEPGYSTKKGHEGIGLSMVLRTAKRYNGRVFPEFGEGIIRFVVNIPNKIVLPEGGGYE